MVVLKRVERWRENGNRVGKGKWINGRPCHPGLFSRPLSPRLSSIFSPPLFVLELLITSLSPLHCIPHSFVILPRKRIREPSLSHHTFPLSHFAFLCLCPLVVRSAPYRLRTLHFDPHGLWCHSRSEGRREVTRGRTSSCPASISADWKGCRKNAHSSGECFPCLEKVSPVSRSLSCPFKEFQSGSLILYFSSELIWCVCTCQLSCYRACYLHQ